MERSPLIESIVMRRKKGERKEKAGCARWASCCTQKSFGQQVLNYQHYRLSVQEWILYSCQGMGAIGILSYIYFRSWFVFWCLSPLSLCWPLIKGKDLKQKRLEILNREFKDGITILASSLTAGYSVENAFRVSTSELLLIYGEKGLLSFEFQYIVNQLKINRPIEQLLDDFAERSGLDDIQNFSQVFSAAKRSGGQLIEIMNHTAEVIGSKIQLREEIASMTAARRLEQRIMNLLPYLIVIYIDTASPGFFAQMYSTAIGRGVMTGCLIAYVTAVLISKKILDIEI